MANHSDDEACFRTHSDGRLYGLGYPAMDLAHISQSSVDKPRSQQLKSETPRGAH